MPIDKIAFEAVKVSVRQDKTGYILTLSIHPDDVPDSLLRCPVGTHFMVGMAEYEKAAAQAQDPLNELKIPPTTGRKLVQQAGILSRDKDFWDFGDFVDEDQARAWICKVLSIDSRKALEYNEAAQRGFRALLADFEEWKNARTP